MNHTKCFLRLYGSRCTMYFIGIYHTILLGIVTRSTKNMCHNNLGCCKRSPFPILHPLSIPLRGILKAYYFRDGIVHCARLYYPEKRQQQKQQNSFLSKKDSKVLLGMATTEFHRLHQELTVRENREVLSSS